MARTSLRLDPAVVGKFNELNELRIAGKLGTTGFVNDPGNLKFRQLMIQFIIDAGAKISPSAAAVYNEMVSLAKHNHEMPDYVYVTEKD